VKSGGGNWNDPANWSHCVPNAPDSEAVFGAAITSDASVAVNANITVTTLVFDNAAHAYGVTGDDLHTLTLAGAATVHVAAGNHQVSAAVSGADGLAKTGPGRLLLSGTNTYAGSTTIAEGTLALSGPTTNNIAGSGLITVNASSTLDASSLAGGRIVLAAGQKLAGEGMVWGGLAAGAGNVLAPGGSGSALTITGGLALQDGLVLSIDPSPSGYVRVTGGTVAGAGTGTVQVHVRSPASVRSGSRLVLIDWQGATANGVEAGDFFLDPAGGVKGVFEVSNSQLVLMVIHGSAPLLGQWKFDEADGATAHNAVNSAFDGVFDDALGGTPMLTWQPGAGLSGGALHLDNASAEWRCLRGWTSARNSR